MRKGGKKDGGKEEERRKERGRRSEQKVEVERKGGRERVREGGTSVWGRFCASCGILATNPAAISSLGSSLGGRAAVQVYE